MRDSNQPRQTASTHQQRERREQRDQGEQALYREIVSIGALIESKLLNQPEAKESISTALKQLWSAQTAQMCAAILIHAFTLSGPPTIVFKPVVLRMWRKNANGAAGPSTSGVLSMAMTITGAFPQGINNVLARANRASAIERAQDHNLTGQLIQQTILDRKGLATYYTTPTAAALLAELAVPQAQEIQELAGPEGTFRIIDPACGAGALLEAAARTLDHRLAGLQEPQQLNTTVSGLEILPVNTALTGSALRSHPDTRKNIVTLPYGPIGQSEHPTKPRPVRLGALELLVPRSPQSKELRHTDHNFRHGRQHLVLMNPPYTRTVSQQAADRNTAEGQQETTPEELSAMENRLAELAKHAANRPDKGLGPMFAVLAQKLTAPGGTMALILPMTAVSSSAAAARGKPAGWEAFRQTTAANFNDITVVTTPNDPRHQGSFSSNTGISETIIIARKLRKGEQPRRTARFICLTGLPGTGDQAATLARAIRDHSNHSEHRRDDHRITMDGRTAATQSVMDLPASGPWPTAGASDPRIIRAATSLRRGALGNTSGHADGQTAGHAVRIPVTTLENMGARVSIQARRRTDFEITPGRAQPPALPFLDLTNPSEYNAVLLEPRHSALPKSAAATIEAHQQAGTVQIANNHRYNSQPLAAAVSTTPCLPSPGWSNFRMNDGDSERAAAVWLNTTIGLVSQWAYANRTQPGIGYLAKSLTTGITVLDPLQLTAAQLHRLDRIFQELSATTLMPASCAWQDPVRTALDHRVLEEVLNIRDAATHNMLRWLRYAWCAEPSVQSLKATRQAHRHNMDALAGKLAQAEAVLDQPPTPTVPISPQLLRDLADAMENAGQNAGQNTGPNAAQPPAYTELRLSAREDTFFITATDADGREYTRTTSPQADMPAHQEHFLVLQQT